MVARHWEPRSSKPHCCLTGLSHIRRVVRRCSAPVGGTFTGREIGQAITPGISLHSGENIEESAPFHRRLTRVLYGFKLGEGLNRISWSYPLTCR
jgi:hypothetical protein